MLPRKGVIARMADKDTNLDRRGFLQRAGVGLAGIASTSRWTRIPESTDDNGRRMPEDPVTLRSEEMEVVLDGRDGLPVEYRLQSGTRMLGEEAGRPIAVTVCRLRPRTFTTATVSASGRRERAGQIDFSFVVNDNNAAAVRFSVRYRLDRATLFVTLEDVHERPGYQLIEVALPQLVSVREEDGPAWLAHGDAGGSLVELSAATPGSLPPNRFWGKVLASLPVVMLGTSRAACVQEVTAFMDATELNVTGAPGRRRAAMGTIQRHRVNGSLSYDMNAGPGAPRIFGNAHTPNLLIEQTSACRLDFLSAGGDGRAPGWLDAAKLVRRRMPRIPTQYYDDKFVYDLMCDLPRLPAPPTPFATAKQIVAHVAALTDRSPQVVHLWGWQYRGKDTGYPAVAEVDTRDGGYEAMMTLMQQAEKDNCLVTLSDNYDDAYRSSPAWNTDFIARRPDGELWKSRNWTGEDSYVQGMAKYMEDAGSARVHYTCERYKLKQTTHIDVLTYYSIRNDWDPARPASGVRNLQARYQVLDLFKQHGVDVSSEFLRYAFIGKVSSFMNGMSGGKCPFGGQPVPLMAAIYRKSAVWGQNGKPQDEVDPILKMLFYNGRKSLFFGHQLDAAQLTDYFYLMLVPWFQLHQRDIESFHRSGEVTALGLEGGATVEIDWKRRTYSVRIGGVEVARNGVTACPLGEDRIAIYSTEDRFLEVPLPREWEPVRIGAIALSIGRPEEIKVNPKAGQVTLALKARRPVMIYRDRQQMQTRLRI